MRGSSVRCALKEPTSIRLFGSIRITRTGYALFEKNPLALCDSDSSVQCSEMARRRFELADNQFERIEDLLPEVEGRGRPYEDHQKVVNGLFWILRRGPVARSPQPVRPLADRI